MHTCASERRKTITSNLYSCNGWAEGGKQRFLNEKMFTNIDRETSQIYGRCENSCRMAWHDSYGVTIRNLNEWTQQDSNGKLKATSFAFRKVAESCNWFEKIKYSRNICYTTTSSDRPGLSASSSRSYEFLLWLTCITSILYALYTCRYKCYIGLVE
jgi:hypothetical protein